MEALSTAEKNLIARGLALVCAETPGDLAIPVLITAAEAAEKLGITAELREQCGYLGSHRTVLKEHHTR